ncbi:phosphotransferase [Clostridium sp.]|uniref:phosphotransferase n=1 Tax=Clostridium sp. TaxID=1506 RepID=UPI00284C960A|nr:phosphotransferase [Clostridium sp.]MDR3598599.1 phosphotransferase [Clostridium sp.]
MNKEILSMEELKRIIEESYDIGHVKEINPILEGASSECFHIITEEAQYLFKDIEMIFMNHPDKEPLVNKVLSERGVPVSKFHKTKEDKYLLEWFGHTFHLQDFINGKIFEPNTAPEWFMEESAFMLGKIHKALEELPLLSKGIDGDFFKFVNTESARISYEKSLAMALKYNEKQNISDLQFRIQLLDKIKHIEFEMDKFTYKNTHGDYFVSQILCGENSINAVIDFTSACVHPACWELIRSYSYADPKCIDGSIDYYNLKKYIEDYMKYSELNKYDIKMMAYLYYYQLAVCDYFSQYYESNNSNKKVLSHYAHWSTMLCKWFEENIEELSNKLVTDFCYLKL